MKKASFGKASGLIAKSSKLAARLLLRCKSLIFEPAWLGCPGYGSHEKEDRRDSKISPPQKAPEWADPKDVLKALERAKRILLLYMPTASKMVY